MRGDKQQQQQQERRKRSQLRLRSLRTALSDKPIRLSPYCITLLRRYALRRPYGSRCVCTASVQFSFRLVQISCPKLPGSRPTLMLCICICSISGAACSQLHYISIYTVVSISKHTLRRFNLLTCTSSSLQIMSRVLLLLLLIRVSCLKYIYFTHSHILLCSKNINTVRLLLSCLYLSVEILVHCCVIRLHLYFVACFPSYYI